MTGASEIPNLTAGQKKAFEAWQAESLGNAKQLTASGIKIDDLFPQPPENLNNMTATEWLLYREQNPTIRDAMRSPDLFEQLFGKI